MKKLLIVLLILFISGVVLAETVDQSYRLGPGDKLKIGVWGNDDLQAEVVVLPDGTIFFPLVGQVKVEGMTIPEAQQNLTKELATYLKNPQVSIVVTGIRTIQVKVLGEVVRPGVYELKPGSNVTDGIVMAGGPTTRAELSRVGVFAPNNPQPRLDISVGKKNKLQYTPGFVIPELLEGDTVYVAETTTPDWAKIFPFFAALENISTVYVNSKK